MEVVQYKSTLHPHHFTSNFNVIYYTKSPVTISAWHRCTNRMMTNIANATKIALGNHGRQPTLGRSRPRIELPESTAPFVHAAHTDKYLLHSLAPKSRGKKAQAKRSQSCCSDPVPRLLPSNCVVGPPRVKRTILQMTPVLRPKP